MIDAPTSDPGFAIYVHWPFCAQKCPYCDFNSHVRFGGWDEPRFRAAYVRELDDVARRIGPRTVASVFFGGGTPSLMQPETTAAILDAIAARFTLDVDAEITLEANPGSVEAGRFRGYRQAGVNRVSLGLQSLRDDELKRLGRIHSVAEAKAALQIAKSTFDRVSFDLIYARPGATVETWRRELAEALDMAGEHLSLYQLTIEPDTPYAALHAAGKLIVPDPDLAAALYDATADMTAAAGFTAYEISNYARPGAESRHNLVYWRYGEYAGIGPGAHGRIVIDGERHATVAEKSPEAWCEQVERHGNGFTERTALSRAEQTDEMLLMGLRLAEGVDLDRLRRLGGLTPDAATIAELAKLGLVETVNTQRPPAPPRATPTIAARNELDAIPMCLGPGLAPDRPLTPLASPSRLRATPRGRFVLNAVVAELSRSFRPVESVSFGRMDNDTPAP